MALFSVPWRSPSSNFLAISADPLLIPSMGDSLPGRMSLLNLYPLSEGEKKKSKRRWVDKLWDGSLFGCLLENFVFNELQKGKSWSSVSFGLFHLRDATGDEIDFILEKRGGETIAIQVKAREMITPDDSN